MSKIKNFVLLHPELFTILGLVILFYFIFFYNIGAYALMDVDESRYVSMAKDMFHSKNYLTLYLNNEYFFEKPPLYFWGECLSFALFGKINEFTARFPAALYASLCCYLIYFMGRKIISRAYGVISALILATSLEFVILAKFAILDILVSTCIMFSLCAGIAVYYCRESRKKYFWWLFYIFSALAVMAKGIPGFVIPFGSMFFIALVSKEFKEIFKPVYFFPGIILFLIIILPWHIIMLKTYDPLFWDEYIIKHHIARFLGSDLINRSKPFYFYFLTLLWGFFPWIISCLCLWIKEFIKIIKERNFSFKYENLSNAQRYVLYNAIITVFTMLFFSSSGTKLVTYILPLYGSLACLGGYIWMNYIESGRNEEIINKTVYFTGGLFLLASFAGMLSTIYLPSQLNNDISEIRIFCIIILSAAGAASIFFAKKKHYTAVFAVYVIFMILLSAHATEKFFEIDYKFGQNDLMNFARYAKKHNISLTTFNFGHKYSLIYYSEKPVIFRPELKPEDLPEELGRDKNLVIIKLKDMKNFKNKDFDIILKGRKYALIDEDE